MEELTVDLQIIKEEIATAGYIVCMFHLIMPSVTLLAVCCDIWLHAREGIQPVKNPVAIIL